MAWSQGREPREGAELTSCGSDSGQQACSGARCRQWVMPPPWSLDHTQGGLTPCPLEVRWLHFGGVCFLISFLIPQSLKLAWPWKWLVLGSWLQLLALFVMMNLWLFPVWVKRNRELLRSEKQVCTCPSIPGPRGGKCGWSGPHPGRGWQAARVKCKPLIWAGLGALLWHQLMTV